MPRTPATVAVVVALAAALAPAAGAATLPAGTTAIMSGTPDLLTALATPAAPSTATGQVVSHDGSRVAFVSRADAIFDGDDDSVQNVYVKDVASGAVTLVSRATGFGGEPAREDCSAPAISADGNVVAFVCAGALTTQDTNGAGDVYARNLTTGNTFLVSRASGAGAVGNAGSDKPAISADGAFVAFQSVATNLVPGDPAGSTLSRIYRRQIANGDDGTTIRVSPITDASGAAVRDGAQRPSISDDGAKVVFDSGGRFNADDTNNFLDVWLSTIAANVPGAPVLVSRKSDGATKGAIGDGHSVDGLISGDGGTVVFESDAKNFDPADPTGEQGVYSRTLGAVGVTKLIGIDAQGHKIPGSTFPLGVSGDGATTVFEASGGDTALGGSLTTRFYVSSGGSSRPISAAVALAFDDGAGISRDATKVAMTLEPGPDNAGSVSIVSLLDLATGGTQTVSRPAGSRAVCQSGRQRDRRYGQRRRALRGVRCPTRRRSSRRRAWRCWSVTRSPGR